MDHDEPFDIDGFVLIYNGERTSDGAPYLYDGHEGNDWGMVTGTVVLAAAQGSVIQAGWENPNDHSQGYGLRVRIDHANGYETLYGHLSGLIVNLGDPVAESDSIAYTGSTGHSTGPHLHLSVYNNGNLTDPFGWRGQQPDPLINYPAQGQGHTASCLWHSLDTDPISCFDTIGEDAGRGSSIVGAWNESTVGNGHHAYYRGNISSNLDIWATWLVTDIVPGTNKVYAFIPSQNATTHRATYWIYTLSSIRWQSCTIEQAPYNDEWISLGTYQLPNYAYVFLYANTQELTNTTSIAADAIKFRSYPSYLPLVLKEPTPTATVCVGC